MGDVVVIAVDSFKGTIGAAEAAAAIADGWHSLDPGRTIRQLPMADGGEGTVNAFAAALPNSRRIPVEVTGPDDRTVTATWLLLPPTEETPGGTGVVELASTSGIELLGAPPNLRPLDAHTRGFGEAIAHALSYGVSRLVLGIGSSASTDGGVGMLSALGARFRDRDGAPIKPGGRGLASLRTADLSSLPSLPPGGVDVLTDVTNPLLGPSGAAAIFGPQKGADANDVAVLDDGLRVLSRHLAVDPESPGAGAAGGTGIALIAWGARLVPGADAVATLIGLPDAMSTASLVITGEGSFDGQSAQGKVPDLVQRLASAASVRTAIVAGRIATDAPVSAFTSSISLTALAGSSDAAMSDPHLWLSEAGRILASWSGG